jgi:protoheme IX farnesyltransferase
MVGLSAFAGACLSLHHIGTVHILAICAACFLSFGCSALNQYQERELDRRMQRTMHRPIPGGDITANEALALAIVLILIGFCFIVLSGSLTGLIIGLVVVVVYNFIYTPFKRISPFSVMLGAFAGAMPPVLGYVMAGGSPFDLDILFVTAVLYLWQTPHFATLADIHSDDYKKVGFKTLKFVYGEDKSRLFVLVWSFGYMTALLFIPFSEIYTSRAIAIANIAAAIPAAVFIITQSKKPVLRFGFLNLSAVLFFILLIGDRLLSY